MLIDSFKPYAQALADLLPARFVMHQNNDEWFLRDETWQVMDLRSKHAQPRNASENFWQFVNTLCGEYNVKNINASGRETLTDASFRALVDAVKQSGANHTSILRPLNEIGRRNLLMQLAYLAPKHLRIHCDVESAVNSIWFDCFINDARCSEIPNIFLTGNDFDSAAGILALWDELDKNWIVSWKKNTRGDESEQCVCEGCEISLIERVDAGNVFKKYTVWSTTRSEAIVRAAVAAWSD